MAPKPDANFAVRLAEIAAMTPAQVSALSHGELLVWLMLSSMLPNSVEVQSAYTKLSTEADVRRQLTGLVFGDDSVGSDVTPRFLNPGYGNSSTAPTTAISITAPRAGTLRNLFVRHHSATSSASMVTYTVQVNGVDTTVTAALAANAVATASNTVNTIVVAQGDRITVKVTKSGVIGGGGGGGLKAVASMEIA